MWDAWKVTGTYNSKDAFVRPWLDYPVKIVGYELVKLAPVKYLPAFIDGAWFMLGSTINPDTQLWLAPGETHAKQVWPSEMAHTWPAIQNSDREGHKSMLVIHGGCPPTRNALLMLTLYYLQ